ncbi:MAG: AAA family ATPase [Muribaculaceae bacterium]|nr:AAA family ATPase [Muribaculaceae bacterium]
MICEKEGLDFNEVCAELKRNYDGYRFAPEGSEIYNPWSILNAMDQSNRKNYARFMPGRARATARNVARQASMTIQKKPA